MTDFLVGLAPAGVAVAVSYAVSRWGYGNLWYMGQLVPAFMVLYLLIAWLSYLRSSTSFLVSRPRSRGLSGKFLGHYQDESLREPPERKSSGAELRELLALENGEDPRARVRRSCAEPRLEGCEPDEAPPASLSRTLLWAALDLAVVSTVLYRLFGIGSRFF